MKAYCQLRIDCVENVYTIISEILGVKVDDYNNGWIYEVKVNELSYIDIIKMFLNILNNKYEELNTLQITKDDITFWILIENDGQTNMEFDSELMKNLGKTGVSLCISFW